MKQTLTLGFSPCPNDTFIFDALVHERISTEGLHFNPRLADVEELNRLAFRGELDVTKLSYHAFAHVADTYVMLATGSALGRNCGPLLIGRDPDLMKKKNPETWRVAIPGKYTTAHFLFSMAYPQVKDKVEVLFSDIEGAVLKGEVDAGVIIHENRFTYADKGLHAYTDLGQFWEKETGKPIPLGGIAARRSLGADVLMRIERLIGESVQYAFDHPEASREYVRCHAQEMDEKVQAQHIALYVNDYSRDLGTEGKLAVETMFDVGKRVLSFPPCDQLFISSMP